MATRRIYTQNQDGTTTVETVEYNIEDQIAEKEAKILEIYNEIEKIKAQ